MFFVTYKLRPFNMIWAWKEAAI